uniref:Xeroderma pigmentosum, complementation group C n=1 Tax=Sphaeramia orbicularis TaxID=375764 RepID=A0A673BPP7_9TELE
MLLFFLCFFVNGVSDKDETIERKVKPRPRSSHGSTSKYFHPVKEEEEEKGAESDDGDFSEVTTAAQAPVKKKEEEEEEDSEEDEDDWEEVEELAEPLGPVEPSEPVLPSQPVQIEIETPEVRKRRKRQAEFENYLRRMMNRYKKDLLVDTHKVHLLCLIANGRFRNRLCCEPDLLAVALSLLPPHFSTVAKDRIDQNYLSGLLKWFRVTFTLNPDLPCEDRPDPRALLERRLASLSARTHQEMTHLFLLVLRSLQLFCRLVLSLQPIPLKPPPAKVSGTSIPNLKVQDPSETDPPQQKASPGSKRPAPGAKNPGGRGGKKAKKKGVKEEEEEEEKTAGGRRTKNLKRRSVASKVSYKEESDSEGEEDEGSEEEEFKASSEEEEEEVESTKGKKAKGKSKRRSGGGKRQTKDEEEDDEDEATTTNGAKRRRKGRSGPGTDQWLEVYLDKTSTWVCVDVDHGVGVPQLCSQNATQPLTYVVSVDEDGFVKDLGRKYDPTWMTTSRKRRVDEEWWEETLETLQRPEDERDRREEKELQSRLLNRPLPVSISEYKNHPLYALKRHLLKYEAVYPPSAAVLGYCRGEPVYSRDCVHTLHSRDTWLKEARTVRLGEEPYKMVKGFSNRSRKARMMSEMKDEKDLPLFGEWQTEEYQPPIAVDGKVPRNDYGNVYLFKPCMLPVGCVHLRLPNLHRVARKLDLDAAPAVTGFDFHGGYSHAVTDGYIVCEEHEEVLRAAWTEDQELQKQKEKEKREKRALSNWTLLVKGLLIRERLKQRYGKKHQGLGAQTKGGEDRAEGFSSDEETVEHKSPGAKTASETLAMSWPQNRQTDADGGSTSGTKRKTTKREQRGQEKHMFPFEKV